MKPLAKVTTRNQRPADRAMGRVLDVAGVDALDAVHQDIFGDTFWGLYGRELRDTAPEGRETVHAVQKWAESTDGWEKALRTTRNNLPATITTAQYMYNALTSDEAIKAALEAAEKEAEAAAKKQAAEAAQRGAAQAGMSELANDLAEKAAEAAEALEQATAEAQETLKKIQGNAFNQAAVRSITQEAAKKGENVARIMRGWGHGPGTPATMDPNQAMEVVESMTEKIEQIMEVAGKVQGFGSDARSQAVGQGVVPVTVTMTKKLVDIVPSEAIKLTDGVDENIRQWQRIKLMTDGLLGYQYTETEDDAGPFVAAVDVSGSMMGQREINAKGVAMGCAMLARDEDDRPYRLFSFSTQKDGVITVNSDDDWREHVKWASETLGGGTDFNFALRQVIDELRAMGDAGKRADVLFISDGDAGISDYAQKAWMTFAEETGSRLIYVSVNPSPFRRDMENLADVTIFVDEALEQDAQREVAGQVANFIN